MRRLKRPPSPQTIEQARLVKQMLDQNLPRRRIAEELHVSPSRISQVTTRLPQLRIYLNEPDPLDRLKSRRHEYYSLKRQALALIREIQRDLDSLNEEIQAATNDRILFALPDRRRPTST